VSSGVALLFYHAFGQEINLARFSLSKPARYYLIAFFPPDRQKGKLWLLIGKKESFSAEDWKQFPTWRKRIRTFHEVE
jgi:hypothetical protein